MKKQELIHVHDLLVEVRRDYERRTGRTLACEEYDRIGVSPAEIYSPKGEHEAAIIALADVLSDAVHERVERPMAP